MQQRDLIRSPQSEEKLGHVSGMFAWDRGLFLLPSRIALDVTRRQRIGFISHAHMDHAANHELTLCSPETAALVKHRLGNANIRVAEFGDTIQLAGAGLTLHPAGHILGAAMLEATIENESLLYTGDFRLGKSSTSQEAIVPKADYLIMECTFGHPRFRLPPRKFVIEELLEKVRSAISKGATPVISAYVLGKAQEVTKILSDAGFTVLQHPAVFELSQIYESLGCMLGDYRLFQGKPVPGTVLIVPPNPKVSASAIGANHIQRFQVTGWANDPARCKKLEAEHWIPLSDHADFDQLIEMVQRVSPKSVFCTHGPKSFVEELKKRGFDARWLS